MMTKHPSPIKGMRQEFQKDVITVRKVVARSIMLNHGVEVYVITIREQIISHQIKEKGMAVFLLP